MHYSIYYVGFVMPGNLHSVYPGLKKKKKIRSESVITQLKRLRQGNAKCNFCDVIITENSQVPAQCG